MENLLAGNEVLFAGAAVATVGVVTTLGSVCSMRSSAAKKNKKKTTKFLKKKKKKKKKKCDNTIVDLLKARRDSEEDVLYTFVGDSGSETSSLTSGRLDFSARQIAAELQRNGCRKGDRVLLCFPPGLEFSCGFFGCLYAGAVAIPLYPPYPGTLQKDLPKFNKMVADSGAKLILTNRTYQLASKMATLKNYFSAQVQWPPQLTWITTDGLSDSLVSTYSEVALDESDVAFFQYSSGSTSDPKAVMISYRNLNAQLKTWDSITPQDTMVSWLPSYHDMGLVGFIIVPCVFKCRCILMSPISFIKKPSLWLEMVTKYKATHICAPNFGYALVARKTGDVSRLDLSTLKSTICAAEPIRMDALTNFVNKFKPAGFDPNTFNCGYGLAEVTLVCSGKNPTDMFSPIEITLDKEQLEHHKIAVDSCKKENKAENLVSLVACGMPMPTFHICIVCPEKNKKLQENEVGEIWVSGDSVSCGYWNRPELSHQTFGNTIGDGRSYLKTGDLGFLRDGHLYVTGRLKDLIIIRGRNVIPQDVELTVEECCSDEIRPGCVAAFSIEENNKEEKLVITAELRNVVKDHDNLKEIALVIQKTVLAQHQLNCFAIELLFPRSIPKTTSGKIQRHGAKHHFIKQTLKTQYSSRSNSATTSTSTTVVKKRKITSQVNTRSTDSIKSERSIEEVKTWLMQKVRDNVAEQSAGEVNEEELNEETPWSNLGMDSIGLVSLSADLGSFLGDGIIVPPSAFFQYDTPKKLSEAPGLTTGELQLEDNNSVEAINTKGGEIQKSCYDVSEFEEVVGLKRQISEFAEAGLKLPYLEPLNASKRQMVNFNTYNYLGLAQDPRVKKAAQMAIEQYGTTMSSSPIVGQTEVNIELEKSLCDYYDGESCLVFIGGWVTNVSVISSIVTSKSDLIVCDALNHNSCVTGQKLSGATVLPFPHNDMKQLDLILTSIRHQYRRVLIVVEGVYSMDGDYCDLPQLINIKKKHKAILFLDEAHSFGTMGPRGCGMVEYSNVKASDVDIRMGTLSKAMSSTGGFVLASNEMISYLKYTSGGFVFSVGLAPSGAAAANSALCIMKEDWKKKQSQRRVFTLQQRSRLFYDLAVKAGLDVGPTHRGGPVVVVILGSTITTATISSELLLHQINVKPIVYPAVEEGKCRLRFFISNLQTEKQITHTVNTLERLVKMQ